ncbi:MAG: PadR family transcriptional regulator [Defluviitaleaceae bacterium]|nr:PadR family transcriptional regulator [Defluviitaleaceae bacterium]
MNTQLKKGTLELCVLCLLARRDMYGFEIVGTVSSHIETSEGTIYPLLKRIKDDGLVTTYLTESQEGPPRKYYKLTDLGRTVKDSLEAEWRTITAGAEKIINGQGGTQ